MCKNKDEGGQRCEYHSLKNLADHDKKIQGYKQNVLELRQREADPAYKKTSKDEFAEKQLKEAEEKRFGFEADVDLAALSLRTLVKKDLNLARHSIIKLAAEKAQTRLGKTDAETVEDKKLLALAMIVENDPEYEVGSDHIPFVDSYYNNDEQIQRVVDPTLMTLNHKPYAKGRFEALASLEIQRGELLQEERAIADLREADTVFSALKKDTRQFEILDKSNDPEEIASLDPYYRRWKDDPQSYSRLRNRAIALDVIRSNPEEFEKLEAREAYLSKAHARANAYLAGTAAKDEQVELTRAKKVIKAQSQAREENKDVLSSASNAAVIEGAQKMSVNETSGRKLAQEPSMPTPTPSQQAVTKAKRDAAAEKYVAELAQKTSNTVPDRPILSSKTKTSGDVPFDLVAEAQKLSVNKDRALVAPQPSMSTSTPSQPETEGREAMVRRLKQEKRDENARKAQSASATNSNPVKDLPPAPAKVTPSASASAGQGSPARPASVQSQPAQATTRRSVVLAEPKPTSTTPDFPPSFAPGAPTGLQPQPRPLSGPGPSNSETHGSPVGRHKKGIFDSLFDKLRPVKK